MAIIRLQSAIVPTCIRICLSAEAVVDAAKHFACPEVQFKRHRRPHGQDR